MESRVIFQDGMDNDPADYNNLQDFVQGSIDHVVSDGITSGRKYAGFAAAATGVTTLTVQPGRFYSGGKVYVRESVFTKDFTTTLPIATKKIVAVVIYGSEVDTDARPREFLINEETGASEPRVVSMERARSVTINTVYGEENADPVAPIVDGGVIVVATVVLSPTGIQSVTMASDTALDSVSGNSSRISSLEGFRDVAAPQIVSLGSDLASLKVGVTGLVGREIYGRMLARLATLEEQSGIPSAAADSDADFFLDADESDPAFAGYLAKVEEGIRFADENANETALAVFDALNPRTKIVSGVLFPAYTREARVSVGPKQGEVQISSYSYQTHDLTQKSMTRTRIRYGESFTVCSNTAWWHSGKYDYITRTFQRNGETFTVQNATARVGAHDIVRVTRYWYDTYQEPYWDTVTTAHAVPGAQVAETFLNANDMWLDAVGLTFTRLAATGGIKLGLCEVVNGAPNLGAVISYTEVDRSSLVLNAETIIPIQPAFLKGGTRYALVVISAADHWLATTQGENFAQGTFFYVLDGAYQQGDGTRDLCFTLYAAKFAASRAVIELSSLSLSGGITLLDILAESIVPGSTSLVYEVNVGTGWVPIAEADESILGAGGNIPPLLQFRAVFTGTPDVMPAVKLTDSRVRVSRPRTSLTHISAIRTLPAPSTQIRVIARLESFDAAHQTATGNILTGAGYTTVVTPTTIVDVTADDGSIERTWVYNLGSAVSSYRIKFGATTDSPLRAFHFGWRKDYAL